MDREQVITAWRDKNKAADLGNAKAKAKDKLAGLSQAEKEALTLLSEGVKKTSVEKMYELLQVIKLSES